MSPSVAVRLLQIYGNCRPSALPVARQGAPTRLPKLLSLLPASHALEEFPVIFSDCP